MDRGYRRAESNAAGGSGDEMFSQDDRQSGRGGHRGGRHHGDDGRHHGRRGGRARRGESKFLLLDALQSGPKHGYEIIKTLEERSGGQYIPSPGVVYPTMQFLAEAGMARADQDGDRRVYHLTDAGQHVLDAHADEIADFWSQFAPPSTADARAEVGFLEEEMEYLIRTVHKTLHGDPDVKLVRRIRQTIENCRNEVRGIFAAATEEPR